MQQFLSELQQCGSRACHLLPCGAKTDTKGNIFSSFLKDFLSFFVYKSKDSQKQLHYIRVAINVQDLKIGSCQGGVFKMGHKASNVTDEVYCSLKTQKS